MPLPFIGLLVGVAITTAVRRLFEHFFPPADRKKPPTRKQYRDESQESPQPTRLHAVVDINPETIREARKPDKTGEEEKCMFVAVERPEENFLGAGDNAPGLLDSTDSSPLEDICICSNGDTSEADEELNVPAAVDITPPGVAFFHPAAVTDHPPVTNVCGLVNMDNLQAPVTTSDPTAVEDSPAAEKVDVSTKVERRKTGEESEVNVAVDNVPRSEEAAVSTLVDKDQLPEVVNVADVASSSPPATDNPPLCRVQLGKREPKTRQKVSNAKMLKLCHQYPPVAKRSASRSAVNNCEQMSVFTNCIQKIINLNGLRNLKVLSLERSNINNLFGLDVLGDTLEELWISFNQIETLEGIECLKNLKILHMSKNMVKEWAEFERLGTLPCLTELVFVGNPLEKKHSADGTWMDQVFQRLPNLVRLDGRFRSFKVNGPRSDGSCIFTAVDDALVLEEASMFINDRSSEVENLDAPEAVSAPTVVGKDPVRRVCGVSWVVDNIPAVTPSCGSAASGNASPLEIAFAKWEQKTGQKVSDAKVIKLCHQNPPVVKMSDAQLSTLTNCEALSLSKNGIEKIAGLGGLKRLKILSLERNKIKELSGLEAVAETLEELWISFNWIERLEGIECLKHLKILHMSKNMVKEWAEFEALAELERLTELVFVGNPLEKKHSADGTWMRRVFKRFPNLDRLDGRFRTFSPFNVARSRNVCVLAAGDNGQEPGKSRIYPPGNCAPARKKVSCTKAGRKIQQQKEDSLPDVSKMSVLEEIIVPQGANNAPTGEGKNLPPEEFIVAEAVNQTPIYNNKNVTTDMDGAQASLDPNVSALDGICCANDEVRFIVDNLSEAEDVLSAVNSVGEPTDSSVPLAVNHTPATTTGVAVTVSSAAVQEDSSVCAAPAHNEAESQRRLPHLSTPDECSTTEELTVCQGENQAPASEGFTAVLDLVSVLNHVQVHHDINTTTSTVLPPLNHTTGDACVPAATDKVQDDHAVGGSSSLVETGVSGPTPEDLTRCSGLEDLTSAELCENPDVDVSVSKDVMITRPPVDFSGTAATTNVLAHGEDSFQVGFLSVDKAVEDFSASESRVSEGMNNVPEPDLSEDTSQAQDDSNITSAPADVLVPEESSLNGPTSDELNHIFAAADKTSAHQKFTVPPVHHRTPAASDVSLTAATVNTQAPSSGQAVVDIATAHEEASFPPSVDGTKTPEESHAPPAMNNVDGITAVTEIKTPADGAAAAEDSDSPEMWSILASVELTEMTVVSNTSSPGNVDDSASTALVLPEVREDDRFSAAELLAAGNTWDLSFMDVSLTSKVGDRAEVHDASSRVETWELTHMDSEGAPQAATASAAVEGAPTLMEATRLGDGANSPISDARRKEKAIVPADSHSTPAEGESWELAFMDTASASDEISVCAAVGDEAPALENVIVLADLQDSPTSVDTWDLSPTDTVRTPEEVSDLGDMDSDLTPITNNGGAHTKANMSAATKDARTSVTSQVPHRGVGTKGRRRKRPTSKPVS